MLIRHGVMEKEAGLNIIANSIDEYRWLIGSAQISGVEQIKVTESLYKKLIGSSTKKRCPYLICGNPAIEVWPENYEEDVTNKLLLLELGEREFFAMNFPIDCARVIKDRSLLNDFKKIYPKNYHSIIEKILGTD